MKSIVNGFTSFAKSALWPILEVNCSFVAPPASVALKSGANEKNWGSLVVNFCVPTNDLDGSEIICCEKSDPEFGWEDFSMPN